MNNIIFLLILFNHKLLYMILYCLFIIINLKFIYLRFFLISHFSKYYDNMRKNIKYFVLILQNFLLHFRILSNRGFEEKGNHYHWFVSKSKLIYTNDTIIYIINQLIFFPKNPTIFLP